MLKIGIDLVENKRINDCCSDGFIDQVLTNKEKLIYIEKKGSKKLEFLCGRFAAKEAIIKAVSNFENPHMLEIEITNDNNGAPIVIFKNYNIILSISHEKKYTIAEAILIKDN